MRALRAEHDIHPEDVEAIELEVPESNLAMCNIPEPETALEGKFSLRFTAAMALADGDLSELAFPDERVNDPRFTALRARVNVCPHPPGHPGRGPEATVPPRAGGESRNAVDLFLQAADPAPGQGEVHFAEHELLAALDHTEISRGAGATQRVMGTRDAKTKRHLACRIVRDCSRIVVMRPEP